MSKRLSNKNLVKYLKIAGHDYLLAGHESNNQDCITKGVMLNRFAKILEGDRCELKEFLRNGYYFYSCNVQKKIPDIIYIEDPLLMVDRELQK